MAVVIETTLGDITVDLFIKERPRACLNFLKLCKIKYYNFNLFHTISRGFIAQTGDPTGSRNGGESVFGVLEGPLKRYFEAEKNPRIKHTTMGLVSFVGTADQMIGSQFFITLGTELTYLDEQHCVFGEVMEGLDVLELLNETICDQDNRPYQDVRITHTVVLEDPYPDPAGIRAPSRSPSPSAERLQGGRIAPDEEIDETEGKTVEEVHELVAEREAKARATILEMVGDIPDAEMAPPENVLFVCKLNPVTTDDDLEIIFSRFGKIKSCEVIRDKKSGDSLQYAFVEFEERKSCEDAYFKMDNVLIDDRRIHVDFSQSVAKVKWHGKGRGVTTYDEKGRKNTDARNDIGKGNYSRNGRSKGTYKFSDDEDSERKPTKHPSKREKFDKRGNGHKHYVNDSKRRRPDYEQSVSRSYAKGERSQSYGDRRQSRERYSESRRDRKSDAGYKETRYSRSRSGNDYKSRNYKDQYADSSASRYKDTDSTSREWSSSKSRNSTNNRRDRSNSRNDVAASRNKYEGYDRSKAHKGKSGKSSRDRSTETSSSDDDSKYKSKGKAKVQRKKFKSSSSEDSSSDSEEEVRRKKKKKHSSSSSDDDLTPVKSKRKSRRHKEKCSSSSEDKKGKQKKKKKRRSTSD